MTQKQQKTILALQRKIARMEYVIERNLEADARVCHFSTVVNLARQFVCDPTKANQRLLRVEVLLLDSGKQGVEVRGPRK